MSDAATVSTSETPEVHVSELRESLARTADVLTRLRLAAKGGEKAKWERVATKVHRVAAAIDRVLQGI
jgi:hypothetical protein